MMEWSLSKLQTLLWPRISFLVNHCAKPVKVLHLDLIHSLQIMQFPAKLQTQNFVMGPKEVVNFIYM